MECLNARGSARAASLVDAPVNNAVFRCLARASPTCQVDKITAEGRNYNSAAGCIAAGTDSNKGKSIEIILFNMLNDNSHRRNMSCEGAGAAGVVDEELLARIDDRQRHRTEKNSKQEQQGRSTQQHGISIKDIMTFCKGHTAVLDSIKFKGKIMREFEQETKTSWFDHPMYQTKRNFCVEAEDLLQEFADNLLDIRDLLNSMWSALASEGTYERVCGYAGIAVE